MTGFSCKRSFSYCSANFTIFGGSVSRVSDLFGEVEGDETYREIGGSGLMFPW
jgi:hypothetical protein